MRSAPLLAVLLVLATGRALPQAAALRTFGVRDGLAHERVNCFFEDRLGFLWIGTWEGLSRFDGREFESFGTRDGLKSPLVWCVTGSPPGRLWIGTPCGGMARQTAGADGRSAFESIRVAPRTDDDSIFDCAFASDGALLAVTPEGIRRCAEPDAATPVFDLAWKSDARTWDVQAVARAGEWTCFLGAFPVVALRGREVREGAAPPGDPPRESVPAQARPDGRCTLLTTAGLVAFDPDAFVRGDPPWSRLDVELPADETYHAVVGSGASLWLGSVHGVQRCVDGRTKRG